MSIPWLRLYTETLSDRKLKLISVELDIPKPYIMGVWTSILMLAGESPSRGKLLSSRGKPWPVDFICDEIGTDEKTFQAIMGEFIAFDMVYIDDGGVYVITNWQQRQFKSDDSYERVKRFRSKQAKEDEKQEGNVTDNPNEYTKRNVSSNDARNVSVTDQNTDTDTESDSKEADAASTHQMPPVIPAYKIHIEETGTHCLTKKQITTIQEVIGAEADQLEKWREVCHAWAMQANKPNNLTGLLEWFKNGIPDYAREGQNKNGHSQQRGHQRNVTPGQSQPGATDASIERELRQWEQQYNLPSTGTWDERLARIQDHQQLSPAA